MPDIYFVTGEYSDYLNWIKQTREALLALNKYNPNNTSAFAEQAENYLKVVALSTAANLVNRGGMLLSDNKIKSNNANTKFIGEAIKEFNSNAIDALDRDLYSGVLEHQDPATSIKNYKSAGKAIDDELALRNTQFKDIGEEYNPLPEDRKIDSEIAPRSEYFNMNGIINGNTDLPQDSIPLPDLNNLISINALQTKNFRYEVFSGYKSSTQKFDYEFRRWMIPKGSDKSQWVPDETKKIGTPEYPLSDYAQGIIDNTLNTPTGTYKFFIEKLHGRYGDKSPYKLNPIVDTSAQIVSGKDSAGSKNNLYNFSNRQVFPAFIDNFNTDFNIDWSEYDFIGRAEKVPVYRSTSRKINLEFTLLTDHSLDQLAAIDVFNQQFAGKSEDEAFSQLINDNNINWGLGNYPLDKRHVSGLNSSYFDTPETTWQKITFLAQCCYPYYRSDGKMKEQPMIRLRIADFLDVICYISSLSYQMNTFDGPMIDFNNSKRLGEQPVGFKISLAATIIHDYEPSSEFFGFFHRANFDFENSSYEQRVFGLGLEKQGDIIKLQGSKKSPFNLANFANIKNISLDDLDIANIQNNLGILGTGLSLLGNSGINVVERARKLLMQKIFAAYDSILSHKDKLTGLQNVGSSFVDDTSTLDNIIDTAKANAATKKTSDNVTTTSTTDMDKIGNNILTPGDQAAVANALEGNANFEPKTLGDILNSKKNNTTTS